ncbi:FliC/FljB family flagellin [Escherichia coli]|uniref:FliC/FljB family flagellin n=1 Tax=Escherichia coli TaxID=562 RepID=UPI001FF2A8EB|nr:FliC/FljB family flagellin [Escherichia coli]EEU7958045.1 FliC/FljB family flagellin [Salmonella enterica subsp. enterica serovar Senftenberg]EEU7971219.1 FliC/FljB family flagellin [Salmonella enterica subsp. enterica serovar Senftenberg]EEU8011889.1 FliC/FljB family flagellin [Salmonella enterica subsp. enterica serovar Senftenberg]EEU8023283.1 FliC/FljB family flagellin [Salmonella enterica subsp. enterica serovar Senftenberg]EEY6037517.1 FliC/FljB family flagellin [Salmonella enterica s
MAQVINTNSLSLLTQNNLNKSQSSLSTSIERLSSGLRINSAKDDAAGQAIANRFTSNIRGLTQASRNANDGISVAQTTEGALSEINNNLQRVRELTVQATNGTNSKSDMESIQAEITQRLDEIDRVSKQTEFNGVNVLGETKTLKIQVGANDNQTIDINLKKIDSTVLNVRDLDVVSENQYKDSGTALKVPDATAIQGMFDGTSTASISFKDGKYYAIVEDSTDTDLDGTYSASVAADGTVTIDSSKKSADDVNDAKTSVSKVQEIDEEATAATKTADPLAMIDKALSDVDALRSDLGAVQNRFDSAITNLGNTVNNLSSARSRIEDADYATEVSNMSRAQILQQAGTSVLAQANQVSQNVLSLLQ